VPALLVQPLVENAIEHGLATTGGGRVRVTARRAGEVLEIDVADDGPGFERAPASGTSARQGRDNGGVGSQHPRAAAPALRRGGNARVRRSPRRRRSGPHPHPWREEAPA
jgi:two-component sensor histidine kinase